MSTPEGVGAQSARVDVVYALPEEQHVVSVELRGGMTAAQAVAQSGLPDRFPEISDSELVLGLFGRRVDPEHRLMPGDRIEVCRQLQRDPRELRRYMTSQGLVIGQRRPENDDA